MRGPERQIVQGRRMGQATRWDVGTARRSRPIREGAMTDLGKRIFGLGGNARECLWQLFRDGPTWDGNICTKAGRGQLFEVGYADRHNGWSFLTKDGMKFAIDSMNMGDDKERWQDQKRRK